MFYEAHAVIDASSIIRLRMESYSPDVFPGLNERVEHAARRTELVTVDRVLEELKTNASTKLPIGAAGEGQTSEQTFNWASKELRLIDDIVPDHTIAEIAKLTADIASQHQRWSRGVPADPMLIAAAEILDCAVISSEAPQLTDRPNPKPILEGRKIRNEYGLYSAWIRIPDICLLRGIQHYDLLSFFRSQCWSF